MRSLMGAIVVTLVLPALAVAQKTTFDFDKTTDFTKFKTYAVKDGTKAGDPLIDNRIVAAIEAELAAKGLTKTEANPDVVAVYHVAFDKQKEITTYSSGGGSGYRYGGWATTQTRVNEILVGTLIIDLADDTKKEVVWRGMGVKHIDTKAKAEKRDKNISSAVKKILQNYPPKNKA